MTQLGGLARNVRDSLAWLEVAAPTSPDTFYRFNQPRIGLYDSASDTGNPPLATGVMTTVRIKLYAGDIITNISVRSGQTAAASPTNYFFALYGPTNALIAQTADQTSTAWAANTTKTLPLSAAYTVPVTGYYYVGISFTGTTPPSVHGSIAVPPIVAGEANLSQTSGSSLTATAPATIASPAVKNFVPYVVLT